MHEQYLENHNKVTSELQQKGILAPKVSQDAEITPAERGENNNKVTANSPFRSEESTSK